MLAGMVLLPELPIVPLDDLQPFLLVLAAGQVVEFAVEEVFSVIGVGVEWVFIVDHFMRGLGEVEVLIIVDFEGFQPSSA